MWPRPEMIRADVQCPICNERYDFTNLQVLDEQDGSTLLYIQCSHCMAPSISAISLGQGKLQFTTTVTDLSRDEVLGSREREMLQDDEVLEIHARLYTQDNFLDLF